MIPQPLRLFHPQFADHIDVATQVDRMPGTADAPCLCDADECRYPFCKPPEKEDE